MPRQTVCSNPACNHKILKSHESYWQSFYPVEDRPCRPGCRPRHGRRALTVFAGVDYDTHAVHVVLIPEDGRPEYNRYNLDGETAFDRLRSVRDCIPVRGVWRDAGIVRLGIEEPAAGGRQGAGSAVPKLKAVQGAILACLPAELQTNLDELEGRTQSQTRQQRRH